MQYYFSCIANGIAVLLLCGVNSSGTYFEKLNFKTMPSKALTNFGRYSDSVLETKTQLILTSMTGNTSFPTPLPALTEVSAAATAYSTALVNAGTGNRIDISIKNTKREELVALLRRLAEYVSFTANNDRSILLSSGFDISKEPSSVTITKPENFRIENGPNSGQLKFIVDSVRGAKSYLHEYTTDDTLQPQNWQSNISTGSKLVVSNLQPGTKYYCRVGAVGGNDQLVYSDLVSRIAQ